MYVTRSGISDWSKNRMGWRCAIIRPWLSPSTVTKSARPPAAAWPYMIWLPRTVSDRNQRLVKESHGLEVCHHPAVAFAEHGDKKRAPSCGRMAVHDLAA